MNTGEPNPDPPPPRTPTPAPTPAHSVATGDATAGWRKRTISNTTPPPSEPSWLGSEISPPPPTFRPVSYPSDNSGAPLTAEQSRESIILSPIPQSQSVPTVSPPYHFQQPAKRINSPGDIRRFIESDSGKNFLGFIVALSESIRGRKISDPCQTSLTVESILNVLAEMRRWVDEIPPVQQSARYGNVSYRTWHGKMTDNVDQLMLQILPKNDRDLCSATVEISPYFTDSFGNSSRIDYGTGHETNFAAWLYCLARLGLIKEEDYPAVVSRIFVRYLELMRKLQLAYCLEPAGSHGVWGLDDYHFMPFIFGSSQLIDHKYMKPKSIHNEDILENFSGEYMYFSGIKFIKLVKKGPFSEHSPLLDDISGVPNWRKVNGGLLKMYKAEVLEKVPIMQHFLFGWLIKCCLQRQLKVRASVVRNLVLQGGVLCTPKDPPESFHHRLGSESFPFPGGCTS